MGHAITTRRDWSEAFSANGIAMIEHAIDTLDLDTMHGAFASPHGGRQSRIDPDLLRWLRDHDGLAAIIHRLTGCRQPLVRVLAFAKSQAANWFVPWHQDRSIVVRERRDVPGFNNWTVKDGLIHVEPPRALLDAMVALRIHLDPCSEAAGPLEVLPGSHRDGPLPKPAIDTRVQQLSATLCLAERGDVLAMRPLLVHRSQRASTPQCRRVLHLEYCSQPLPGGLEWALDARLAELH